MALRPYARSPAALLSAAGAAGALLGWLARSRLAHRHAARRPWSVGPESVRGPSSAGPASTQGPPSTVPESAGGPSPLAGPVPVRTVDAPYTAEEPYTGRPRSGSAAERTESDVPGGAPP